MEVPLFKIYSDETDVAHISEAIRKGMDWAIGPNVELFEEMICEYISTKYAVVFNSGTSALHATLLAHNIKSGDEVIVPSFTFIATANAPLFVGAKPVFADIEEKTYGLNPESVKEKITPKTKAIIPIHYGGNPCLIKELKEIADDNSLILIEDAAEAFGAKIKNENVGTFGDSAVFSFCANKIISTGEGGAVTTNSPDVYRKLKLIRSHGRVETSNYFSTTEIIDYTTLGYNFRMSNIIAALGIAQLSKVDKIIKMRVENAKYMDKILTKIDQINPISTMTKNFNVYQMYSVMVDDTENLRNDLMKYLSMKNIMTKVYFEPVHLTHFYRDVLKYDCKLPITEQVSKHIFTLPMYPTLTVNEIDYIVEQIERYEGFR